MTSHLDSVLYRRLNVIMAQSVETSKLVTGHCMVCVCVCWVRGQEHPRVRPFCLLRPSALALACRGFITGAGGLPRRRGFSCMCTAWLPAVPVVGDAPLCLCLVPRWRRVRCDVKVVCWLDACTAAWSGVCCLWLVQRCWPALVGWRLLCVPLVVSCSSSCLLLHS